MRSEPSTLSTFNEFNVQRIQRLQGRDVPQHGLLESLWQSYHGKIDKFGSFPNFVGKKMRHRPKFA